MVNIWNTTTQFIVIGMAAFCISFGVIYSLIFCYKSRRKNNCSEENERLRDELLREKFIARRKSTSLTSPPLSDSVVNPNYNASPYKTVPTRHLRSTSYSPTHYLSPHHRRNSTPTQQPPQVSNSNSVLKTGAFVECSCCGAPRGITKSKSALTSASASPSPSSATFTTISEHLITPSPNTSLSSSGSSPGPHLNESNCCCKSKSVGNDFLHHPMEQDEEEWREENNDDDDFLSTHKCKLIPVLNHPRPKPSSKPVYSSPCFSFGPIPAARKARKSSPLAAAATKGFSQNSSPQNNSQNSNVITFTVAQPTFTTTQANLNVVPRDCEEWEEKQPLLINKKEGKKAAKMDKIEGRYKNSREEKNDDNDYENADKNDAEDDSDDEILANRNNGCPNNNMSKRKVCRYSEDLFEKKESKIILDEIPYYIEQRNEMNCN